MFNFLRIESKIPRMKLIRLTAMINGIAAMIKPRSGVNRLATSESNGLIVSLSAPADTAEVIARRTRNIDVSASFTRTVIPDCFSFFVKFSVFASVVDMKKLF